MRPCCCAVRKIEFRLHHLGPLETLSTHDVIVGRLLILLIAMVPQRIQARRTRPSLARSPGVAPQAPDWALEASMPVGSGARVYDLGDVRLGLGVQPSTSLASSHTPDDAVADASSCGMSKTSRVL